jgi:hypothetical protein
MTNVIENHPIIYLAQLGTALCYPASTFPENQYILLEN